jgi:hypothetical protein
VKISSLERVRHGCRSQSRPRAGARPESGTHVVEPEWDRGAGPSHVEGRGLSGDDRTRTADPLLANQNQRRSPTSGNGRSPWWVRVTGATQEQSNPVGFGWFCYLAATPQLCPDRSSSRSRRTGW